jgi:hypothetical protein
MQRPAVLEVENGRVVRKPVEVGLVDDREQRAEIRRGLEPGDVVLLGAAQAIPPGTAVHVPPVVERLSQRLPAAP